MSSHPRKSQKLAPPPHKNYPPYGIIFCTCIPLTVGQVSDMYTVCSSTASLRSFEPRPRESAEHPEGASKPVGSLERDEPRLTKGHHHARGSKEPLHCRDRTAARRDPSAQRAEGRLVRERVSWLPHIVLLDYAKVVNSPPKSL